MNNSLIFFKNGTSYSYKSYDCCESLGMNFMSSSYPIMYIGIPIAEMDEFFMIENNLKSYLSLISESFAVNYEIATKDEISHINDGGSGFDKEKLIFIKVTVSKKHTNKYFNVTYNAIRYLWYKHYTNMAIIATNLYNLNLFKDPMDILAIAFSYQDSNNRAVLPVQTTGISGLLFFRPKADILKELNEGTNFNNVFYKYPIYFNPIVKVKGSFFEESETIIKAKEMIYKLSGVTDVSDIPSFTRKSLDVIKDDYLLMKGAYKTILYELSKHNYALSSGSAVLLSREMNDVKFYAVKPDGTDKLISISFKLGSEISIEEEQKVVKKQSVELPF